MRILSKGYVQKVESKEKKEKDEEGNLIGTGEFYDKITIKDCVNGAFVSFSIYDEHNIEEEDFISLDGSCNISTWQGKCYFSVKNPNYTKLSIVPV